MILDPGGIGFCLSNLGLIATASKEFDQARAFLEESRAIFEEDSNIWGQAIAGINLAALHKTVGDTQAAFGLLEESLDICRGLGHRWGMTTCLFLLADISRQRGDLPAAEKFSQDARAILAEVGRLIIS
jgi:tetratricopeptide (TPR) repeat protein